jgi:hypothetical protein
MKTNIRYRIVNAILGRDESRTFKTRAQAIARRAIIKARDKHLRGHGVLFIYKTWREDGNNYGEALD